ncbi:MAG TPA: TIGR02147 family protein [bacterium]|jgi:uncharacterized protein (TIGR02147 family)
MNQPSIFDYLDYRAFLKDTFQFRKERESFFSHRYFARRAGFTAPNFLQLVITGRRNLTSASIPKVAKGLSLKAKEREYFESLVLMNQADSHDERNHYYQKLTAMRGAGPVKKLEKASFDYFSNWYFPVIREVATWGEGRMTAAEIAGLLQPPVAVKEAERALTALTDLGLLQTDDQGRWRQCDAAVTTGPEVRSLVLANYHREMIRLGGESIERYPPAERDITTLTVSVRDDWMDELKEKIAAFRHELLDLVCQEDEPGQVIQINFQAFPLTKVFPERTDHAQPSDEH